MPNFSQGIRQLNGSIACQTILEQPNRRRERQRGGPLQPGRSS